jgi:hypothetical protein
MASSLRAGLRALPADTDAVVVVLGDMPFVSAAHIDRLIAAFDPARGNIVVPMKDGRRGNPIVWPRAYFAEMQQVQGDVGARELLQRHADRVDRGSLRRRRHLRRRRYAGGAARAGATMSEATALRAEFPLLVANPGLHYLDSAATAQMHRCALDAVEAHETGARANVLRGSYRLAEAADRAYEAARQSAARFLNAASADEIVFTGGTTAALNLVAHSFGACSSPATGCDGVAGRAPQQFRALADAARTRVASTWR